jgi:hypothetical protein
MQTTRPAPKTDEPVPFSSPSPWLPENTRTHGKVECPIFFLGDSSVADAVQWSWRLSDAKDPKKIRDMLDLAVGSGVQRAGPDFGYCTDGHALLRQWAAEAIIGRYARADPDWAIDLLARRIELVHEAVDLELYPAIGQLADLADTQKYPAATNRAAVAALLDLLKRFAPAGGH